MTSSIFDPVQVEALIVEKIRQSFIDGTAENPIIAPIINRVYSAQEFSTVKEQSQMTPAVAVIYNGMQPIEQKGDGVIQSVEYSYIVSVVTRSSFKTDTSEGAKRNAGAICFELIKLLTGWKPAAGLKRLTLQSSPGAAFSDAGYAYLPLSFSTRITFTSNWSN